MTNPDWRESYEGDFDPDLTEEAGYGNWDPPRRSAYGLIYRATLAFLLVVFIASALAVFLR